MAGEMFDILHHSVRNIDPDRMQKYNLKYLQNCATSDELQR